ncbi:MAG: hydrophobe/amphiphile efflux-3 (HAE3) family transporter [Methanolinea sp.]|nr:hydrophobe/amphiphile efflux-3 (HAE3) family transporter [Methanolinea sp.]
MASVYEWLADRIVAHPRVVGAVAVGLILVAMAGLTMVTMKTGKETYIEKATPRGAALTHYTNTYQSDAIMVIFESDDITDLETLHYIKRLQDDIADEMYVAGVSGVVDLLSQGNGGELPRSVAEVNRIIAQAPPEVVARYMPSRMMTISVVTLQPALTSDRQQEVLGTIRNIVALSHPPPGVKVTLSGSPAFSQEMMQEMGSSMRVLILAAMVLMVVAVMTLFHHVRYTLLPVGIVGVGLVLTFGVMGLAGIPISMVVIGAFPVLIGIGIDYAIQIHSRLDEESRKVPLPEAVRTTVTKTGPAVLIAMLATSMGFIAMVFGPIPMVGDFGITCTIGVVSCYLAALVLVPVFAMLVGYRPKAKREDDDAAERDRPQHSLIERYDAFLGNVACRIARNPVPVLIFVFLFAIVGFSLDNEVPISADEKTFVPSEMPALQYMNKVTRTMGSTTTIPVMVSSSNVLDPETVRWIYDFGEYERTRNDKITGVTSIATLLARYNNGILPSTEEEIRQVLARIPEEARKRYLSGNIEAVMEFSTVDLEISQARSQIALIRNDLLWYTPPAGASARVTGTIEMFSALIDDIKNSKTTMTLLGFAFILAFLLAAYRRLRAVSPLLPIVAIVGWNGAIMYWLGLDYTPLTAVLGSMTIGVASEYTILIMERVEEEMGRGLDLYSAIRTSVQRIGTAITVSGLTTVFGFSALILSEFNIVSNFGITTVITVGFSLIGAILIMPAIIALMYGAGGRGAEGQRGEAPAPA